MKFEYKVISSWNPKIKNPGDKFLDDLNIAGQEGWEAVGMSEDNDMHLTVLLKRRKIR